MSYPYDILMTCHKSNLKYKLNMAASDGLRYFIVALPEPSINYFVDVDFAHQN